MDADTELEADTLSAYIRAPVDIREKVQAVLRPTDFTDPFFMAVYRESLALAGDWDVVLLNSRLKERVPRYTVTEFARLSLSKSSPALAANYAHRLRELNTRREVKYRIAQAAESLNGKGSVSAFQSSLREIDDMLSAATEKPQTKLKTGSDLLDEFDREHQRMQESDARSEYRTQFNRINEALGGGLMRGELTIVGGRPGDGKTTMALNLVHNFVKERRKSVLFASLEMGVYPLVSRLLAIEAKVPHRNIMHGLVSPIQQESLDAAKHEANGWMLTILDDPEVTYQGIEQAVEDGEYDILIVDYLQLVNTEASDTMNRYERVGLVSRSLKKIARKANIPVLSLAQLSRHKDKPDKKPTMDDLRESGNIEQDADNIWLMHVGSDQKFNMQCKTSLILDKNRNGPREQMELVHFKDLALFEDENDAWQRSVSAPNREDSFDDWNEGLDF